VWAKILSKCPKNWSSQSVSQIFVPGISCNKKLSVIAHSTVGPVDWNFRAEWTPKQRADWNAYTVEQHKHKLLWADKEKGLFYDQFLMNLFSPFFCPKIFANLLITPKFHEEFENGVYFVIFPRIVKLKLFEPVRENHSQSDPNPKNMRNRQKNHFWKFLKQVQTALTSQCEEISRNIHHFRTPPWNLRVLSKVFGVVNGPKGIPPKKTFFSVPSQYRYLTHSTHNSYNSFTHRVVTEFTDLLPHSLASLRLTHSFGLTQLIRTHSLTLCLSSLILITLTHSWLIRSMWLNSDLLH